MTTYTGSIAPKKPEDGDIWNYYPPFNWAAQVTIEDYYKKEEHWQKVLRALADLPVQLTPQQLRTAADLLETWTGTLPELLTTISEITAPRQVAE